MQTQVHSSIVIRSEAFRQGFDSGMNGTNNFHLTGYPKYCRYIHLIVIVGIGE